MSGYIHDSMKQLLKNTIVVKIGGSTLGANDTSLEDLVELQRRGENVVVVHGGGRTITDWLKIHNIPSRFVNGLRVTDAASLDVVVAVLSGLVNKQLVASILALGGRAIGISGLDGGFIKASILNPELGYVGEVSDIDSEPLRALLEAAYMPIISPVALQKDALPTGPGLLNLNADTVAGEVALALAAKSLIFLTDVEGVLDASGRVVPHLSPEHVKGLLASGVASGGMIPKLEACLKALQAVPSALILDGRKSHALMAGLSGDKVGTIIE